MKFKFTFLFLSLLGAVFLSVLTHEFVHVIQAKEPYSICYDIRQESIMSVSGIFPKTKLSIEIPAFIVQGIVLIMMFIAVYIDWRKYAEKD